MMYHVFYGNSPKHLLRILPPFILYSHLDNFYVIFLEDQGLRKEYDLFFSKYTNVKYAILSPTSKKQKATLLRKILQRIFEKKGIIDTSPKDDLFSFLLSHRFENIIFHGTFEMYGFFFTLCVLIGIFKKVSWVNWGVYIYTYPSPFLHLRKYVNALIHVVTYRKLKKIICLLSGDREALIKLRVNKGKIYVCPYAWSSSDDINNEDRTMTEVNAKSSICILLGNNGGNLRNYLDFVKKITSFPSNLYIEFMLCYGMGNTEVEKKLLAELTQEMEKKKISYNIWEKTLPYSEYIRKMSNFDIYICNNCYQSGLGAIYNMVSMKKTLYLEGMNLTWMQELGFIVYSVNQFLDKIKCGKSLFLTPEQLISNTRKYKELFNSQSIINQWDGILR